MSKKTPRVTRAPLVHATVWLLLALLYAGSYVALVIPEGEVVKGGEFHLIHYRLGDSVARILYWPLERIDRKVRRFDWDDSR